MNYNGESSFIRKDELFPFLALKGFMPQAISVLFILGLIAAAYSSADSALTALTTSFCIDILGKGKTNIDVKTRTKVHIGFAIILFLIILLFYAISNDSVITLVFKAAGYTYGPLLGLYTLGIFTKRKVKDKLIPIVCILAPILTFLINHYQGVLFGDFKIGFLILIINGCLTFVGLLIISKHDKRR
jgi:Na+/proline symporter